MAVVRRPSAALSKCFDIFLGQILAGAIDPADHEQPAFPTDKLLEIEFQSRERVIHDRRVTGMNSAAHVAVVDAVVEREHLHASIEQPFPPSAAVTQHMIGGSESGRLRDLRLLLRLKDRAVRTRNRNCVLPQGWVGQSENKRDRTPTAELDFGSEANHAISDYQTLFAAVSTVKQNQPTMTCPSTINSQRWSFLLRPGSDSSTQRRPTPFCPSERSGQPGEKRQGRDRIDRREERRKILADFNQ